jgi:hypothetical protein
MRSLCLLWLLGGCVDATGITGLDDAAVGDLAQPADLALASDLFEADLLEPPDGTAPLDLMPICTTQTMSCYGGPKGTVGVGACRAGTQSCINNMFGPCIGEVDPAPESCNGVDDNCNGTPDENLGHVTCGLGACQVTISACISGKPSVCIPGTPQNEICGNGIDDDCNGLVDDGCACTYVSQSLGTDTKGCGPAATPCQTIQYAITNSAGQNGLPPIVCVAATATCSSIAPATVSYAEDVVMKNGVNVYGGYQSTGTTWLRVAGCVTTIEPTQALGVQFDHTVTSPTILDGFTVNGHDDATSAAITVAGSTGAIIAGNAINGAGMTTSYGVNVMDAGSVAATPRILANGITGGNSAATAVGVRSLNSAPIIQGNCDTIDASSGRCTAASCFNANPPTHFIRGRAPNLTGTDTFAVRLESSPGAVVDANSLCTTGASGNAAGLYLAGSSTNVLIRANTILSVTNSSVSAGVWADPCGGASPWIFDNQSISAATNLTGGRTDGVRAIGDCHVRVDSNVSIIGGIEQATTATNGVWCARDSATGISSRCTILTNQTIHGSGSGNPPTSAGVRCDDGACARIENNALVSGQSGVITYGLYLGATNTFVNNNHFDAGCAVSEGNGLYSNGSFARVQNNFITGPLCSTAIAPQFTAAYGVHMVNGPGANELDLHSNDVFAQGSGAQCTGSAIAIDAGPAAPGGPLGLIRNDILDAGGCATRYHINELSVAADPRLVLDNDFTPASAGTAITALYRDESSTNLTTIAQVNALATGEMASANISVNPMFVSATDLHLTSGSMCIDSGTASGAPATDFDGDARPRAAGYDIGMDEF